MPPWKTVHDHDGGELRGHGRAVPHARAGCPVPGLAGLAGPHHLPLPAHAALLVVSILPTGVTAWCICKHFLKGASPGEETHEANHWGPTVRRLLAGFSLCFWCV